jgi:AAA family ATP:ADP antiporter
MILRFFRMLWGDMTAEEFKKFGILSVAMALIIGNYWMIRITKDALFDIFVGFRAWQPIAKIFSVLVMVFVAFGYSKLVDLLNRQRLIYVFCTFYGLMFIALSYFISNPGFVALSETSALYPLVSWIPGKALGWFIYVLIESYGSLLIAIFYMFVASVTTTGSAKKGWGMLATVIQFGTLSGILTSMFYVKKAGSYAPVYCLGGVLVLIAPFVIRYYLSVFPQDVETDDSGGKPKKKTGFVEGVRLILTRPYIVGILVVATFYEIMSTIVEYQMNWIAVGFYPKGSPDYNLFRGIQGIGINGVALLFAFIGTSFFMRKYGLKFCLIAFPCMIALVLGINFGLALFGVGSYIMMWTLLCATVVIKGLNYALNKPASEVMYIPTSKDVKFKSKAWIDMFGNRSTKGAGSVVSKVAGRSGVFWPLILTGTIISLGIIGVWLIVARFVGNKFNDLQDQNKIVE